MKELIRIWRSSKSAFGRFMLNSDPYEEETVLLDTPEKGLYIGPYIWREMFDFSPGAVLLVLASHYYDPADYIRDYSEYVRLAEPYFAT